MQVVPSAGREQVYEALRAADVFVFPTLSEGFSKALLEAMAAALPVVTTASGPPRHPARRAQRAAGAASRCRGHRVGGDRYVRDPELAARHGAAARVTAEAYRLEVVCRQWAERLYAVVDRHARDARGVEARRDVVL